MERLFFLELHQSILSVVGEKCWSVAGGKGTGSMIVMNFGEKIQLENPISNPFLSEEARNNTGSYWLYLQDCSWRVDSENEVICGWTEENDNEGAMIQGLNRLIGQSVQKIDLIFPSFDLVIEFGNFLTLRVFCDQLNPESEFSNYSFSSPSTIYIVKPRSKVSKQYKQAV